MGKEIEKKEQKKKSSTKKIKVIGTEKYTNQRTGEVQEMQVISLEDRDFNFEKIWMFHILDAIGAIGGQKIKVLNTLLTLKNNDNIIIGTQRNIAEKSGAGLNTVNETMKLLLSMDFLRKKQEGVYLINPSMIFRGSNSKRMRIVMEYTKIDSKETKIGSNPETYLLTDDND